MAESALTQRLIKQGCAPRVAKAPPPRELVERLARWIDPAAFEDRPRSSRNQHAANVSRTRALKLAKHVLRFRPIAEALAGAHQEDAAA